jgi:hypothetical protein
MHPTFESKHVQAPHACSPFKEWRDRAEALAEWTMANMVNRVDVWGAYRPFCLRDRTSPNGSIWTKPAKKDRGKRFLTKAVIVSHYRAYDVGDIIGLHSTSPQNTSRWCFVDIDWHGKESPSPELNWAVALNLYQKLVRLGFTPLLEDSNGAGGYHLGTIFIEPVATSLVFAFLRWLTQDHKALGLPAPLETFPKQSRIDADRYGNWLRLPGRHHTRSHWSRIWNGQRWLEGNEAIEFLLCQRGDPPSLIPQETLTFGAPSTAKPRSAAKDHGGQCDGGRLDRRISAYLAKLPNLSEGQGRDDVAYHFAAFLVRDLQLPDDQALSWLSHWDSRNNPPKGTDRLNEIIVNAHRYGRSSYGSGLSLSPTLQKFCLPKRNRHTKRSSIHSSIEL